ncbi:hypothetical protein BDB01DRAFT_779479, partial [Pilobolus umbonatus]
MYSKYLICTLVLACLYSIQAQPVKRGVSNDLLQKRSYLMADAGEQTNGYVFDIPLDKSSDPLKDGLTYLEDQHQDGLNAPDFDSSIYDRDD